MANGADFIRNQDDEIEHLRSLFQKATEKFAAANRRDAPSNDQSELLRKMHKCGAVYYRCVEAAMLDHDTLVGEEFKRWLHDRVGSAYNVLNGLPKYYGHIRTHRDRLQLPNDMFEPSPGVYRNMQSVFAACEPENSEALKARFLEANLPVSGFENPFMPKESSPKRTQWWLVPVYLLAIVFLLIALVVASHYVSPWLFIPILVGVIVLITIIGAFQLKNDDRLADKPFVELMGLALKKKFEFFKGPISRR
ncbi:MAG: hypothetical protein ACREFF_07940 [Candidatus Udaeobacter sp.]